MISKVLDSLGRFGFTVYETAINLRCVVSDRRRIWQQAEEAGTRSIPLILVVGFFSGAIIAWQAAYQIRGLAPNSILGGQIMKVIAMEMAPILTALVMSGRIGASMAAEIGSMKISEQVDALYTLSIDPNRYIAMPRVAALLFMMPVLTVFSNLCALLGAYLVCSYFLDMTGAVFVGSIRQFLEIRDISGGLFKAMIFGLLISLIGCHTGLNAQGGSRGLGASTVRAFVRCAVWVLVLDFALWLILF